MKGNIILYFSLYMNRQRDMPPPFFMGPAIQGMGVYDSAVHPKPVP